MNLNNMLTGKDNVTLDIIRVSMFIAIVVLCSLSAINYTKFEPMSFGGGIAAILTAGGAGIMFKKDTEPEPQATPEEVKE